MKRTPWITRALSMLIIGALLVDQVPPLAAEGPAPLFPLHVPSIISAQAVTPSVVNVTKPLYNSIAKSRELALTHPAVLAARRGAGAVWTSKIARFSILFFGSRVFAFADELIKDGSRWIAGSGATFSHLVAKTHVHGSWKNNGAFYKEVWQQWMTGSPRAADHAMTIHLKETFTHDRIEQLGRIASHVRDAGNTASAISPSDPAPMVLHHLPQLVPNLSIAVHPHSSMVDHAASAILGAWSWISGLAAYQEYAAIALVTALGGVVTYRVISANRNSLHRAAQVGVLMTSNTILSFKRIVTEFTGRRVQAPSQQKERLILPDGHVRLGQISPARINAFVVETNKTAEIDPADLPGARKASSGIIPKVVEHGQPSALPAAPKVVSKPLTITLHPVTHEEPAHLIPTPVAKVAHTAELPPATVTEERRLPTAETPAIVLIRESSKPFFESATSVWAFLINRHKGKPQATPSISAAANVESPAEISHEDAAPATAALPQPTHPAAVVETLAPISTKGRKIVHTTDASERHVGDYDPSVVLVGRDIPVTPIEHKIPNVTFLEASHHAIENSVPLSNGSVDNAVVATNHEIATPGAERSDDEISANNGIIGRIKAIVSEVYGLFVPENLVVRKTNGVHPDVLAIDQSALTLLQRLNTGTNGNGTHLEYPEAHQILKNLELEAAHKMKNGELRGPARHYTSDLLRLAEVWVGDWHDQPNQNEPPPIARIEKQLKSGTRQTLRDALANKSPVNAYVVRRPSEVQETLPAALPDAGIEQEPWVVLFAKSIFGDWKRSSLKTASLLDASNETSTLPTGESSPTLLLSAGSQHPSDVRSGESVAQAENATHEAAVDSSQGPSEVDVPLWKQVVDRLSEDPAHGEPATGRLTQAPSMPAKEAVHPLVAVAAPTATEQAHHESPVLHGQASLTSINQSAVSHEGAPLVSPEATAHRVLSDHSLLPADERRTPVAAPSQAPTLGQEHQASPKTIATVHDGAVEQLSVLSANTFVNGIPHPTISPEAGHAVESNQPETKPAAKAIETDPALPAHPDVTASPANVHSTKAAELPIVSPEPKNPNLVRLENDAATLVGSLGTDTNASVESISRELKFLEMRRELLLKKSPSEDLRLLCARLDAVGKWLADQKSKAEITNVDATPTTKSEPLPGNLRQKLGLAEEALENPLTANLEDITAAGPHGGLPATEEPVVEAPSRNVESPIAEEARSLEVVDRLSVPGHSAVHPSGEALSERPVRTRGFGRGNFPVAEFREPAPVRTRGTATPAQAPTASVAPESAPTDSPVRIVYEFLLKWISGRTDEEQKPPVHSSAAKQDEGGQTPTGSSIGMGAAARVPVVEAPASIVKTTHKKPVAPELIRFERRIERLYDVSQDQGALVTSQDRTRFEALYNRLLAAWAVLQAQHVVGLSSERTSEIQNTVAALYPWAKNGSKEPKIPASRRRLLITDTSEPSTASPSTHAQRITRSGTLERAHKLSELPADDTVTSQRSERQFTKTLANFKLEVLDAGINELFRLRLELDGLREEAARHFPRSLAVAQWIADLERALEFSSVNFERTFVRDLSPLHHAISNVTPETYDETQATLSQFQHDASVLFPRSTEIASALETAQANLSDVAARLAEFASERAQLHQDIETLTPETLEAQRATLDRLQATVNQEFPRSPSLRDAMATTRAEFDEAEMALRLLLERIRLLSEQTQTIRPETFAIALSESEDIRRDVHGRPAYRSSSEIGRRLAALDDAFATAQTRLHNEFIAELRDYLKQLERVTTDDHVIEADMVLRQFKEQHHRYFSASVPIQALLSELDDAYLAAGNRVYEAHRANFEERLAMLLHDIDNVAPPGFSDDGRLTSNEANPFPILRARHTALHAEWEKRFTRTPGLESKLKNVDHALSIKRQGYDSDATQAQARRGVLFGLPKTQEDFFQALFQLVAEVAYALRLSQENQPPVERSGEASLSALNVRFIQLNGDLFRLDQIGKSLAERKQLDGTAEVAQLLGQLRLHILKAQKDVQKQLAMPSLVGEKPRLRDVFSNIGRRLSNVSPSELHPKRLSSRLLSELHLLTPEIQNGTQDQTDPTTVRSTNARPREVSAYAALRFWHLLSDTAGRVHAKAQSDRQLLVVEPSVWSAYAKVWDQLGISRAAMIKMPLGRYEGPSRHKLMIHVTGEIAADDELALYTQDSITQVSVEINALELMLWNSLEAQLAEAETVIMATGGKKGRERLVPLLTKFDTFFETQRIIGIPDDSSRDLTSIRQKGLERDLRAQIQTLSRVGGVSSDFGLREAAQSFTPFDFGARSAQPAVARQANKGLSDITSEAFKSLNALEATAMDPFKDSAAKVDPLNLDQRSVRVRGVIGWATALDGQWAALQQLILSYNPGMENTIREILAPFEGSVVALAAPDARRAPRWLLRATGIVFVASVTSYRTLLFTLAERAAASAIPTLISDENRPSLKNLASRSA